MNNKYCELSPEFNAARRANDTEAEQKGKLAERQRERERVE